MVRKSTKATPASAARSSSKRAAPEKPTPTRQSKRAKATPAKSAYFEHDSDGSDKDVASPSSEEEGGSNASDFEDAESKDASSESEPEVESSEEEEVKPKKGTPRGRAAQRSTLPVHKKQADEKELWKPGAKLAPGTQLIIKKPKAREAGDTPYSDDTIHPNTMLFLGDLAANNDRVWLKSTSHALCARSIHDCLHMVLP
jgi:hypothetical protein